MTPFPALRSAAPRLPLRRTGGFALLLTLTLVAFIVLLLVGLATYTKVETAIAGNQQRQAQAREQALFALNVAVGQLQQHAGPDTRVTATAEFVSGVNAQRRRYTGVWDTRDAAAPPVWLASGMETGISPDVTAAIPTASQAVLAAANTDGSTSSANVVAALQTVAVPGVPGQTGSAPVGRYAWWVADQGVKAPVAVPDSSDAVDYGPWAPTEQRARIRQQIAIGAGAADVGGAVVFEPRDANNRALVAGQTIALPGQLAFLKNASNGTLGLTLLRQNFHTWSPNNHAVLANSRLGGLRRDLSLQPDLLGPAFASWAKVDPAQGGYMEDPANPLLPNPRPAFGDEPLRRRYVMQGPNVAAGVAHSVAPVLSYFLLSFNIRTVGGSTEEAPLEARARWMVSLWNPHTAALVPEKLGLRVSGLPSVDLDDETVGGVIASFPLDRPFGSPLVLSLPWDDSGQDEERKSWLPGRVYTWTSLEDESATGNAPEGGYASRFNSRNLNADGGQGVKQLIGGERFKGDDDAHVKGDASTLTLSLYAARPDGEVPLATFTSPQFEAFSTSIDKLSAGTYQVTYLFRLKESLDTPDNPGSWLATAGQDFRQGNLGPDAFVPGANGPAPELYPNETQISAPDRLLDRATGSLTYNEDVPVFELPRGPLLSVGALQHLALDGARPFSIGNSWVGSTVVNDMNASEVFDRFYFSGLVPGVEPGTNAVGDLVLPNPQLKAVRPAGGARVTAEDLRAEPAGFSSRLLLQGGAFNLNSTNPAAWASVLRAVRFPTPQSFTYLDADASTGTGGDADVLLYSRATRSSSAFPSRRRRRTRRSGTSRVGRRAPTGTARACGR